MRVEREFSPEVADILNTIPENRLKTLLETHISQLREEGKNKISSIPETAVLSEEALADWNRTGEEEAWQHLQ